MSITMISDDRLCKKSLLGVGVVVLSFLKKINTYSGLSMLGIGLVCIAILQLAKKK